METDSAAVADAPSENEAPESTDSGVVIETRNLSKIYRDFWGRKKVHALKSLDIEVRKGEIFGLLGPNGSGKSTTIKLILGLLFPTSGRVLVFDKDATETKKNERIGYLPEESYLYKFLTAEETLDFYGRLFDMSGAKRKQRVAELIQLVGLQGAKHRQLREYSKGMTRRVGLAQALINDPDLIMLDEPTTGLDPIGTREMKDLILALRDQGKTVLLCSHQLADVQDVCDRVAILHQGELKELGRVSDLLKVQDVTEVHASGLSQAAKDEIAEVIKRHGGDLKSIDNPTATMEDLFLNIVRESEARPGARRVSAPAPEKETEQDSEASDTSEESKVMSLEPEDFWSFYEWLVRPDRFLESALLQGIVLIVLAIVMGLMLGYLIAAARYGPSEGFYSMARVIKDLVTTDLPGTSPRRIFALARLAFKEAIRRKVLFAFGLFVLLIMVAGWFLNPDSDNPGRLYISFALTTTNYLILALALFISAFSIPEDIKKRTIYTIVTKPVRPTEVVIGRLLGFVAVGTAMLVPMGVLSYFFVKRSVDHLHYEIAEVENEDGTFVGETDYSQNHSHNFSILKGENDGLTDMVRGHRHIVTKTVTETGESEFSVGEPEGALRARIPSYGSIEFLDRQGNVKEAGVDIGRRRILAKGRGSANLGRLFGVTQEQRSIEHGYVEGGSLGAAIYTFKDVTPERYPTELRVDMAIRAYRSWKGTIEQGIQGTYALKNPDNKTESKPVRFVVKEYQVVEYEIPNQMQGTLDTGEGTKTTDLDLFKDLVNDKGEVQLVIRCIDDQQYLGMTKSGVYLRPAESSFEFNLFKAYASIWLQMTMVMAFGVMFSTFLSGPVAMIACGVCVLLGFGAEQIYYTRENIDKGINMGGGPIESLVRLLRQDAMTTQLDVEGTTSLVIKKADAVIVYCLDAIATSLPNLPKMVSTAEYAASGFDIFNALLARHAVATCGYTLLAFFISYFFLKSREIAA